jgi:hypothetical protein
MLNIHIDIFNLSGNGPEEPIDIGKRERDGKAEQL